MTPTLVVLASILLATDPVPGDASAPAAAAVAKKKKASRKTPAAAPAPAPVAPAPAPVTVSAPRAEAPTVGKELRTIALSEKQAARVHIVRVAPSYPVTLEFPEPFAAQPACGDCGDKNGLFRLDLYNDAHYLTIKPRLFAGPQPDGSNIPIQDFVTNLTVRLQSYTLTIQVEYTDDPSRADPRVIFTIPGRQDEAGYVQAELAKHKKKLEEEMAPRVQRAVTHQLLRSFTEPHSCTPLSARSRRDDLVLEAQEVCIFGSRYFFRFLVENRGRQGLDLGEATIKAGADRKSLGEPTEVDRYLTSDRLEFQGTTVGVVSFHLDDGANVPRLFELAVHERGGKGRDINVSLEP